MKGHDHYSHPSSLVNLLYLPPTCPAITSRHLTKFSTPIWRSHVPANQNSRRRRTGEGEVVKEEEQRRCWYRRIEEVKVEKIEMEKVEEQKRW